MKSAPGLLVIILFATIFGGIMMCISLRLVDLNLCKIQFSSLDNPISSDTVAKLCNLSNVPLHCIVV